MRISLVTLGLALPSGAHELSVGTPVPAVTLPRIESGAEHALDEQLGHKLMLHLFASW